MRPRSDPRLVPYLAVATTAAVVFISKWFGWPFWAVAIGGIALVAGTVYVVFRREHLGRTAAIGRVPALAPAFQPRTGVQALISDARGAGRDIVLHGPGGTGTTQLAASLTHGALRQGADLVVWVDADGPTSVVTAFALAARQLEVPGTGTDAPADARAFLGWLAATDRPWLVVLDGVTDPVSIDAWWPADHPTTGWYLITTTGPVRHPVFGRGTAVAVDVFSPAESHEYFTDRRLAGDDAAELATELGHQPLALARAAAYMHAERIGCTEYLNRWIDRRKTMADPANAAILLAVDAARKQTPQALPALRLAAVLDPAGQPAAVWKNAAVATYLAGGEQERPEAVMRTVALLHRYGLVDHDRRLGARAVRVHPDTAHTVRKNTPETARDAAARTAADAVLDAWPDDDAYPEHLQVLRANAAALARLDGDPLWQPEVHELLWRAGSDLEVAARLLRDRIAGHGEGDEHALTARWILATGYRRAGRAADAVRELERVLIGYETLGHPGAGAVRDLLATVREELP